VGGFVSLPMGIREPFLAIFFILAGLRFDLSKLIGLGFIGGIYIVARTAGLAPGGAIAGKIVKAPAEVRSPDGWCILPRSLLPWDLRFLPRITCRNMGRCSETTIIFEVAGPLTARHNLRKAGELSEQIKQ